MELLEEFAGKSEGVLKDMTVGLDVKEKPGGKLSYVITVIFNGLAKVGLSQTVQFY